MPSFKFDGARYVRDPAARARASVDLDDALSKAEVREAGRVLAAAGARVLEARRAAIAPDADPKSAAAIVMDEARRAGERRRRRDRQRANRERTRRAAREPGEDREEAPPPPARDAGMLWEGELSASELARLAHAKARCAACGKKVLEIEHAPCGSRYFVAFGCNSRLCERCGRRYREEKARAWDCLGNLEEILTAANRGKGREREALKFVTLTFRNLTWESPDAARDWFQHETKRLREFWRSRRCSFCRHVDVHCPCVPGARDACGRLKRRSRGCRSPRACSQARTLERWGFRAFMATWEVTAEVACANCRLLRGAHDRAGRGYGANRCERWEPGEATGRFHPHIHLLVWSRFIPTRQLSKRWEAWGGGAIVDVRNVVDHNGTKAVAYLLKYLAKPWLGVPPDLQVVALHRSRRLTAAGEFYGRRFNGERACAACGQTRSEHKAGEIDCPGWDAGERVGGLRSRLASKSARSTWRVACGRCGLAVTGPSAPWELGDMTDSARAPPEWSTVRVCHPSALPIDPAAAIMVNVRWDGAVVERTDAWGEPVESVQRVAIESDPAEWNAIAPASEDEEIPF